MTESVDKRDKTRAQELRSPAVPADAAASEAAPRRNDAPGETLGPTLEAALPRPGDARPTPLQQAQQLMVRAWEASGRTRIRLARKALALSHDCADAYVLLGDETARSLEDACSLYEQGVKAGERALGESFERLAGDFSQDLARAYLRARYALADCLWALGRSREAIAHLSEMLRLNPNDEQSVHHVLARFLLETDNDKALGELLDRYPGDAGAFWSYTRALHAYRAEGPSFRAEVLLKAALCVNYHVPAYLLGRATIPDELPPYYLTGQQDEAITYAAEFLTGWAQSDDALDWLAEHTVNPHPHRGH